jgi:hypothetical protein
VADAPFHLEVRGVREMSAALKAVDAGLPKALQKGFKKIAQHVIDVARRKMEFGPGPAASSLRPRATSRGTAGIAFPKGGPESGHDKVGYYPWLDFGGGKPGVRGISATSPIAHARSETGTFKRQRVDKGRYLYPAIGESRHYIAEAVDDVLADLIKAEDLETTRSIV